MPAIEIVCIGQKSPARFRRVPFAVLSECGKLQSHYHASRFQPDFDRLEGCIYHLGCPHLRRSRTKTFEAYDLLSTNCHNQWPAFVYLEFEWTFMPSLRKMLRALLERSPVKRLVFTSDYEFSPSRTRRIRQISLGEFWAIHQKKRLCFNALYNITLDGYDA